MKLKDTKTWFKPYQLALLLIVLILLSWSVINNLGVPESIENVDFKSTDGIGVGNTQQGVVKDLLRKGDKRYNGMSRESYLAKQIEQYKEQKKSFLESPFVIKNGKLIIDQSKQKAINLSTEKDSVIAIEVALDSLVDKERESIPNGTKVIVNNENGFTIIIFESKIPEGVRGPDYLVKVKINTHNMEVVEILGGS